MKRLYVRCNGGHYFLAGSSCPFDGWTTEGLPRVAAHFTVLLQRGPDVTVASLKEALISDELMKRLLIIEFADESGAFEALAPEYYLHRGKMLRAEEVDLDLM